MAGLDKDRATTDSQHGPLSWHALWIILLTSLGVIGALWAVFNAAGTDWSIPIAIVLTLVGLAALFSERKQR